MQSISNARSRSISASISAGDIAQVALLLIPPPPARIGEPHLELARCNTIADEDGHKTGDEKTHRKHVIHLYLVLVVYRKKTLCIRHRIVTPRERPFMCGRMISSIIGGLRPYISQTRRTISSSGAHPVKTKGGFLMMTEARTGIMFSMWTIAGAAMRLPKPMRKLRRLVTIIVVSPQSNVVLDPY